MKKTRVKLYLMVGLVIAAFLLMGSYMDWKTRNENKHHILIDYRGFIKSIQCDCQIVHNKEIIMIIDGQEQKVIANVYRDAFGIKFIEIKN